MAPDHRFTPQFSTSLRNAQVDITTISQPGPQVRVNLDNATLEKIPFEPAGDEIEEDFDEASYDEMEYNSGDEIESDEETVTDYKTVLNSRIELESSSDTDADGGIIRKPRVSCQPRGILKRRTDHTMDYESNTEDANDNRPWKRRGDESAVRKQMASIMEKFELVNHKIDMIQKENDSMKEIDSLKMEANLDREVQDRIRNRARQHRTDMHIKFGAVDANIAAVDARVDNMLSSQDS